MKHPEYFIPAMFSFLFLVFGWFFPYTTLVILVLAIGLYIILIPSDDEPEEDSSFFYYCSDELDDEGVDKLFEYVIRQGYKCDSFYHGEGMVLEVIGQHDIQSVSSLSIEMVCLELDYTLGEVEEEEAVCM